MANNGVLIWLAAAYLVVLSLAISVIDFRRLIIPNALNAANVGGGFAFSALLPTMPFLTSLAGGAIGFATMLAFRISYKSIRGREGLGFGDVKFMAGAGLWVGWQGLAPLLLVSSLSALVFLALRGMLGGDFNPQRAQPFGPFLCIGMLTVWTVQALDVAPWIMP